jgi:hypothetical protein
MNTGNDQAGNSNLTVNQAAQSFASLLDKVEPVDSEGEAQAETEEVEASAEFEDSEQVEAQEESSAEESEEEASGEEEEAEEEGESQPEKYTVKVDGEEIEVTRDELIRGYQREADYTRKTQKLAQERKAVDGELMAIKSEREQYSQLLGALQQKLQELEPPEPNWQQLEDEDPLEYARQWTHHQRRQQQRVAIAAEQQRLMVLRQAEQQKHLDEVLQSEAQKVISAIPEWKDEKVLKADRQGLLEYGNRLGFTPEELNGITDSRAVLAIYKAYKYDQLQAKKPAMQAKVKSAPKMAAPGSVGTAPKKVNDVTRAKQRLAQSGSVRDAANLFEKFI